MSTKLWIVTIVVVACSVGVGTGLGVYFGMKKQKQVTDIEPTTSKPVTTKKQWSDLIKTQVIRDEFNISDILEWINGFRATLSSNDKIYLFKSNQANIEKIGYEYVLEIDENTNIVGCVINSNTNSLSRVQLFTFGSASDQVIDLFNGFDYAVIEL